MSKGINFNGKEEMEELYRLATQKGYFVGATLEPIRKADELKGVTNAAEVILVIATDKPVMEHVLMSDKLSINLAISATFLIEELKGI